MQIFEKKRQIFDLERFKGKNQNSVLEARSYIEDSRSKEQQDYKFRKTMQRFTS
jgi:hypothetical protein